MESSEEIRRVIDRWMRAVTAGDADPALGRLSEHPGAVTIGTDPEEWWYGHETRAVWGRQLEELGDMPVSWNEIEAWEEGTVGWAGAKMTLTVTDGTTHSVRATYVLHLERGDWKLVRCIGRSPQPNAEVFAGRLMPAAIGVMHASSVT